MPQNIYQFQGNSDIYLQGRDALEPVNGTAGCMTYFVGSAHSKIRVRDHREKSIRAAIDTLNGRDREADLFADIFNQPGWVKIQSAEERVEIDIHEGQTNEDSPTLWLGVIHDGKMAVNDIVWEVLKPVSRSQIAFAALIR